MTRSISNLAGAWKALFILGTMMFLSREAVSQPSAMWKPKRLAISVPAGGQIQALATITAEQAVAGSSTVEISPELSPYATPQPITLPPLVPRTQQVIQITFTVPLNTPPQVLSGALNLRVGASSLTRALPVVLTITEPVVITAKGLTVSIPNGWAVDQKSLSLGGPISLNNFKGAYSQGGLRPPNGADIDITSLPLPNLTTEQLVERDLAGVPIDSMSQVLVGGEIGLKVVYSFEVASLTEKDVAIYVPHSQLMYKFFLAYKKGVAGEAQFLSTFDSLISSVHFSN